MERERDMEQNQGDVNDIESEGMVYEENELQRNGSSFSEKSLSDGMIREPLLVKSMRTNTTSQIAIVGANVCPIESLDYEIIENYLFKQDWRSRKKVQIYQYVVLKWTFALLIGLSTGLVGFFNNLAVENVAGFKLLLTSNLMLHENAGTIRLLQHMQVVTWFWQLLLQPSVLTLPLQQPALAYLR